ncbi:hypothetical protein K1719_042196 [Acacia pycnantha]|nr:hypothetical protein K1719_042196 [Acacia pycnantha]
MVYGAYLTVQPWSLDFDAKTSVVSKMVAWIRIPGLSFRYYHKSTLRAIGTLLGEVVKIDYMTETRGRGKYARVTILIDLLRPLIPWIKVDGKTYGIEYEGLPHICFACGKYGHTEKKCPDIVSSTNQVRPQDQGVTEGAGTTTATPSIPIRPPSVTDHTPEEASSPFGSWMQIAQTGALTNSDCDTRTDEKSPINRERKLERRLNEEHVENSKNKHNHGPAVSLPTSVVTNNGGMDRCSNPSPIDVPVTELEAIEGVIPTVPPVDPVPHVIQVPSSLDQEMHTVMFLQQSRAALEESNLCSLTDDMGSVARGKENRKPLELQKKQVGHGIKLHSTIRRNLKVKQKTQGTTISKDAIEILREELEATNQLYTMSPYGKLDESEQEKLVDRRKTRKRITIMSLSAVVLVGIVVAAVLGTSLAHNNDKDDNSSSNNVDVSASVKAVCDVTLFKDACYASLGRVVQPGQVIKPEDMFRLALQVALDEVSGAADKYFSGEKGGFEDLIGNDNRTVEAFSNCKELLDLAVDHLNASLSSGQNSSSVLELFEDIQTWLSASGTYQQTCIDGLEEAKESLKNRVRSYLKNSTEFTSNSLAIITWIQQATSTLNLRRRLLLTLPNHNEAPAWLHQKDRKLLASYKDLKQKADIVVAKDGSGKYRTISDALKHVPQKSKERTVIYVKKGVYYENVRVKKNKWNVVMIGDGMNTTIVSGRLNFVDGTPTFSSATFAVFGKNFMAKDMGFRNTAGPQKHQAMAPMAIVIQNSNIFPKVPMWGQQNTITAQGKIDPNMNTGISIQNCSISPFGNLSSVQAYLGRPWKNYATTVFIQSSMGDLINPSGWLPWVGNSAPDTIFYAEFQNFGPGASTNYRVKWKGLRTISAKQAKRFTVKAFLQGDRWIPVTSTPYKSSL